MARLPAYKGRLDVVLLAMADDPEAEERAHRQAAAYRSDAVSARVQITRPQGLNRKASQLSQLSEVPAGALVLSIDSDCLPASIDLAGMVGTLLAEPAVGAVWQPVVPQAQSSSLGDRVEAAVLAGSGHAMPLLAQIDPKSAVGKALLYVPDRVAQSGGWSACQAYLAEDIALSRQLRRAGYQVQAHQGPPARGMRSSQPLAAVIARLVRWLMAVRAQRRAVFWSYPLYFFSMSLQLALCFFAYNNSAPLPNAALPAALGVASRCLLALLARSRCGHRLSLWQAFIDVALAEATLAIVFVLSCCQQTTRWHGVRIRPKRPYTVGRPT